VTWHHWVRGRGLFESTSSGPKILLYGSTWRLKMWSVLSLETTENSDTASEPRRHAILVLNKKKVKQSLNSPGVTQRVPGGLNYQIFMTFVTWRWWGCQPHAPAAFTPRKCSWYLFSLGAVSTPRAMVRSEGNMSLKNPVTPPGIDTGTVRIVTQRLNH